MPGRKEENIRILAFAGRRNDRVDGRLSQEAETKILREQARVGTAGNGALAAWVAVPGSRGWTVGRSSRWLSHSRILNNEYLNCSMLASCSNLK